MSDEQRRVGVAVAGVGCAVATTAVAGVDLLTVGVCGTEGLPSAPGRASTAWSS